MTRYPRKFHTFAVIFIVVRKKKKILSIILFLYNFFRKQAAWCAKFMASLTDSKKFLCFCHHNILILHYFQIFKRELANQEPYFITLPETHERFFKWLLQVKVKPNKLNHFEDTSVLFFFWPPLKIYLWEKISASPGENPTGVAPFRKFLEVH